MKKYPLQMLKSKIKHQICIFNVFTTMEGKVEKWGNSLGIRIPISFSTQAGITEGSSIEFSIDGEKISIVPKHKNEYSIDELVSMISEINVHYEIKTNGPVGNKI